MKRQSKLNKIYDFIINHNKIFIAVTSILLITAISAVTLSMLGIGGTEDDELASRIGTGVDKRGFDPEESELPNEFEDLTDIDERDDEDEPYEVEIDDEGNVTLISQQTSQPLRTGLPAVHINTDSGLPITSRNTYASGIFQIMSPNGEVTFPSARVQARGRGNSTWLAEKKPYRIKFDNNVSIPGLPRGKQFVLLANAYDQSHVRNSVAFAAARVLNFDFVPTAVHVDLYVNGRYQGLYTIGDFVRAQNLPDFDRENGFLVEMGGAKDSHVLNLHYFHSTIDRFVRVRYPEPVSWAQMNSIRSSFTAADNAVLNFTNYEDHLDMHSVIDYFLLTELLFNLDGSFARSVFLSKNPDEKIKIASVWDFDLSMGNYSADRNRYNTWACVHTSETYFTRATWINHLIRDEAFRYAVRKRWEEVGARMYNAALAEVSRNRAFLGTAVLRNSYTRPFQYNIYSSAHTNNIGTWRGQLDYIENFLALRKSWMDTEIAKFPSTAPQGRNILPPIFVPPPVATTVTVTEQTPSVVVTAPPPVTTTATSVITSPPTTPYWQVSTPTVPSEPSEPTTTEAVHPTEPTPSEPPTYVYTEEPPYIAED
jgi:hypothetical protein